MPPTISKFLHLLTQSEAFLRSTCPYHLSRPRLTTLSPLSIPKPCLSSSHVLLSFRVTPDIHLTIYFPFSGVFTYQPPSSPKFRYHTRAPSVHTLYISFLLLSRKLPSLSATFYSP